MRISVFLMSLCLMALSSCKNHNEILANIETDRLPVDSTIKQDTSITSFIKPYKEHLNATLDSVLAYNPKLLSKSNSDLNTAIGNLMADIVMDQTNPIFKSRTGQEIDFVLLNHGGIRSELPEGNVTARSAYNLMPFENEIVIAEISGKKVQEMLDYLSQAKTAHPVSGIKITANQEYKILDARVNGKKIDENKTYFVATSDYLQQGGDNMSFLQNPVNLYRSDYKLRNEIIDYFEKTDTIKAEIDNRYIRE